MCRLKSLALLSSVVLPAVCLAQFQLVVAETRPGAVGNPNDWLGVKRYSFASNGAPAVELSGIAPSLLRDPGGLTWRNGELCVANRHGNGAPSSVSRFLYNAGTDSFDPNGTITGNSLFGSHGLEFRPGTNELYVSNVSGPVSGFDVSPGSATPIGTFLPGASRDVLFDPTGQFMYKLDGASGSLTKYRFSDGLVTTLPVTSASGLHYGVWQGGSYYAASYGNAFIHRIDFDSTGDIASSEVVAVVGQGISVAFSPDGQEMFVGRHTTGDIARFLWSGSNWAPAGSIVVNGIGVGDLQTIPIPEPGVLAVFTGLGLALVLRRRRASVE